MLRDMPSKIRSNVINKLKETKFITLVDFLTNFDKTRVNLNTLIVNVSDGGKNIAEAVKTSIKTSEVTTSNVNSDNVGKIVEDTKRGY